MNVKLSDILSEEKLKEYKDGGKKLEDLLERNFLETEDKKIKLTEKEEVIIKPLFFKKVPLGQLVKEKPKNERMDMGENTRIKAKKYKGKYKKKTSKVAIILESPHKDEYKKNNKRMIPIAPAQGVTGTNLKKIIDELTRISKLLLDREKTVEFFIINPVPYQTSLYAINKGFANTNLKVKNWEHLWGTDFENCQTDFQEELEIMKPDIILNCCTSEFKNELKSKIKNITKLKDKYLMLDLVHPSSSCFTGEIKALKDALNIVKKNCEKNYEKKVEIE